MYLFFEQDSKLFNVECNHDRSRNISCEIYRSDNQRGFYINYHAGHTEDTLLISKQEALTLIDKIMSMDEETGTERPEIIPGW